MFPLDIFFEGFSSFVCQTEEARRKKKLYSLFSPLFPTDGREKLGKFSEMWCFPISVSRVVIFVMVLLLSHYIVRRFTLEEFESVIHMAAEEICQFMDHVTHVYQCQVELWNYCYQYGEQIIWTNGLQRVFS